MLYAIVAVLILIADQLVKFLTTKNIPLEGFVELLPGVIHLTNIHNEGAAFGSLAGARWILVAVSLIFVVAIIVLISREIIHTPVGKWMSVMVLAGALGNCIDRVLYGYVVDMFELEFIRFAVFNVADIFITVCGIIFCIHLLLHNEPEEVKKANEPDFVRRRREAKELKEEPFADIPKQGVHHTPSDELTPSVPEDDPFSDLEFGAEADSLGASASEKDVPSAEASDPSSAKDGWEDFSLDDILSEFGNF